jgi:TonB family protein
MKQILLTIVAVVLTLFPTAQAKTHAPDIRVTAAPTEPSWAARLSRTLDERMTYPTSLSPYDRPSGFARVLFSMNRDGTIRDMSLLRRSGSRAIDRAAMKAVSQLSGISVLPYSVDQGREIEADLFFADDEQQLRNMVAENRRWHAPASQAIASTDKAPIVLASLARMPDRR